MRDPDWDNVGFVETWLNRHATLTQEQNVSGFRWLIYRPLLVSLEDVQNPLDLRFGDTIRLWGYEWQAAEGEDSQISQLDPGGALRLTLFWQATDRVKTSYAVFVHLTDARDDIWAQRDSIPQGGDFPTDKWMAGDVVTDRYSILVPEETLSGDYLVIVGMYDPATGQRLPIKDSRGVGKGDHVTIGRVRVL